MSDRMRVRCTMDFVGSAAGFYPPHCSTAKLWTLIALRLARIIKHLASVFVQSALITVAAWESQQPQPCSWDLRTSARRDVKLLAPTSSANCE
jgi:hypothetical protein